LQLDFSSIGGNLLLLLSLLMHKLLPRLLCLQLSPLGFFEFKFSKGFWKYCVWVVEKVNLWLN